MILADTAVWVDHLRGGDAALQGLLEESRVLVHLFVIGELACGNLQDRGEVLNLLQHLPQAPLASHGEALFFIEKNALMGRGIGYIDAHLLAATALADESLLWTRDKRLAGVAADLQFNYEPLTARAE